MERPSDLGRTRAELSTRSKHLPTRLLSVRLWLEGFGGALAISDRSDRARKKF